jgi:putative peptidoglycan lipid II flippase
MIFKNSVVIGIFTVLSVLLGVLRDRLLSVYVGVGSTLDIYNAAFRLPDLALGILFAFVSSATVIPFISKAVNENNQQAINDRISSLFLFFGSIMTLIGIIVIIIIPYIAHFLVPGFSDSATLEYIRATRVLMIQPILLGLSTLLSTYFQAQQRFYIYGSAPLLYTSSIIVSILLYPNYGLQGLILGVVFGAFTHFALQLIAILRHGIVVKPRFFKKDLLLEQLRLSAPRSGSVIITQLRTLFFASFATTLGVGVLSAYLFALRIKEAILLLIPQTLATASIPYLAKAVQGGDEIGYTQTVSKLIRLVVVVSLVIAVAVIFSSELVVRVLYGNSGANELIRAFLVILMYALPFASFNFYISNALSASRDTKTYFVANCITTPTVIAAALWMRASGFGVLSLAYGVALASISISVCIVLLLFIKKHIYAY